MAILTWSDATYSVKNPIIDAQHKRLFEMVNEMHDAMRAGKGNEVLGGILNDLITYTKSHFAHEERAMAACGYPDLEQHKELHKALTDKAADLQKQFQQGRTMMTIEVMNFLKNWLTEHIQGVDRKYVPHMNRTNG